MATTNPFDLLGDDDGDDPSQLIAKQQQKIAVKKSTAPPTPGPAKLPSKPPPPSQAVKEAKKESAAVPRGGAPRGRGRDLGSEGGADGFRGGYGGRGEGGESNRQSERGRGAYGRPRQPFHGGSGTREEGGGSERPPHRQFERRSGTGRGYEMKREGAGRGNWGASTDEALTQEPEETVNTEAKVLTPQKQLEKEGGLTSDADKKTPVNEAEEKEPENKEEMTLDEYQKVLEEKRKAFKPMKIVERKVDLEKEFGSMQQLKKGNDDVFIKLGTNKDLGKQKEIPVRDERVKKSLSINEFLKPADGERYYSPGGRGRGRGRSDRGSSMGFTVGSTSTPAAPSIEDPGQFPTLGGK